MIQQLEYVRYFTRMVGTILVTSKTTREKEGVVYISLRNKKRDPPKCRKKLKMKKIRQIKSPLH